MTGTTTLASQSHPRAEAQAAIIGQYLKQLKLPAMARDYQTLARDAERQDIGYLGYLQALLEHEVMEREERQVQRRLVQARFPYEKRLEDFDFSAVPALPKAQVLALAQGAFVGQHENVLLLGPSGLGKTHLLLGVGRACCLRGYRVLFRTAATLAGELELAQQELRLPKLLAQLRRFDLILVDEVGYLPFSRLAAELLFQFFSDRHERASVGITSNLDFAHWTEVFGHERMTAALLDRLVHRSTILLLDGESYRFRQSLQRQAATRPGARDRRAARAARDNDTAPPAGGEKEAPANAGIEPCNGHGQVGVTASADEDEEGGAR